MAVERDVKDAAFIMMILRSKRGVYFNKKAKNFEVKVWDQTIQSSTRQYSYLGYHFCAEAAARTADKAIIVMSHWVNGKDPDARELIYRLEDYDPCYINELKAMTKDQMAQKLKNGSKVKDSKGCPEGLVLEAQEDLRRPIRRRKSEI